MSKRPCLMMIYLTNINFDELVEILPRPEIDFNNSLLI